MHKFQHEILQTADGYYGETKKYLRKDHREFVESIEVPLKNVYADYLSRVSPCTLENVTPVFAINSSDSPDEQKRKLKIRKSAHDLYEQKSGSMNNYWYRIIGKNGEEDLICPICGVETCKHLDHYIPREQMPELSVFTPNLIPLCADCNEKKSALWLNSSNERLIFNAFYDRLPNKAICECQITIVESMPCAKVKVSAELQEINADDKRILSTIKELKLISVWRKACNKALRVEISKIRRGFKKDIWPNTEDYWNYIREIYNGAIADLPDTFFIEKLLYEGLIDSSEMKEWVCKTIK